MSELIPKVRVKDTEENLLAFRLAVRRRGVRFPGEKSPVFLSSREVADMMNLNPIVYTIGALRRGDEDVKPVLDKDIEEVMFVRAQFLKFLERV